MQKNFVRETYILGDVIKNIRFQRHILIDGSSNPAKLSLPYVKDSFDPADYLACNLSGLNTLHFSNLENKQLPHCRPKRRQRSPQQQV